MEKFKIGKHVGGDIPPVLLGVTEIERVLMSCGGGLGGAQWYEYGDFVDEPKMEEFVRFKDYFTGETKVLNPRFIVKIEDRKVARIESDLTQNHNFHHDKSIRHYIMARDAEFELVDECNVEVDKNDAECIRTEYIG